MYKIESGDPKSTLWRTPRIRMNTTLLVNVPENDYFVSITLHFTPDRVNTFIARVMNDMSEDGYLPYKILLSAGIYRVYMRMVSDIDASRTTTPADVRELVRRTIGGPWTASSPWCVDHVAEFVLSRT